MDRPIPALDVERRENGSMILRTPRPLGPFPVNLTAYLRDAAGRFPDRTFLAQRGLDRQWRKLSYGEARGKADAIAQWLLDRGFGLGKPVMILSENSLAHALLTLGALQVGAPLVPVSPAYSLLSQDFGKLKMIFELTRPRLVFAESHARYANALAAIDLDGVDLVLAETAPAGLDALSLDELMATPPGPPVERALAGVTGDTVAKILFTSGSTGVPKGVLNTHRNLCAAQQMLVEVSEIGEEDRETIYLDWLPWHHTFGGNAVFNGVMRNAGTLYIDEGRPAPGRFAATLTNLREISPTNYSSVPAAFAMLADEMERDPSLRASFFRKLRHMSYGGAALPQEVFERIEALAAAELGERIPFGSGYGMTETAALNTTVYWTTERMGLLGLPCSGAEMKLVPIGPKYEVRMRGPHIMPGYLKRDDLNAACFDEEGYFKTGDAVVWADPDDPLQGLAFAGRVTEDFKLLSGTWVNTGPLRLKVLDALSPLAMELLVAGQDRDYLAVLVWPNVPAMRSLAHDLPQDCPAPAVLAHPAVTGAIREGLRRHNAENSGSSARIERIMFMAEPPSLDAGEITDKQSINQRAALERRAALVERLYAEQPDPAVFVI